jgi:hypothetical protein
MSDENECRYPNGNVLYRRLKKTYPRIVRAQGSTLYDADGTAYLDACGGAYVANIGHGVKEVAAALSEQAGRIAYVNGTAFTHDAAEKAASDLADLCAPGLDKVFFLLSGSDAVEAALKSARQYWAALGRPSKTRIISLTPSYHGSSLLALSASGRPSYQKLYGDWMVDVLRIPAPYAYRCACGGAGGECRGCSGKILEDRILEAGADNVAAFIAEPVGGSSTGCSVPSGDWMRNVRAICDKYDVLFIADEVLTGAGRTGTWSALEPYDVIADMQIFGKGITGGYAPLSALVTSKKITDVFARTGGSLPHNQTFSHFAVSCAASSAAIAYIRKNNLIERSAAMGRLLHEKMAVLLQHPNVGDVRGRGLLAGVEFVEDKASKRPFERSRRFTETFTDLAQGMGLVVWQNSGQADGVNGDLAMVAPPFVITEREIDKIVDLFGGALRATVENI